MFEDKISRLIEDNLETTRRILADEVLRKVVQDVAGACVEALKKGGKLLFMGNGGSAADCQHLAGEMVCRFAYDRPGLTAFALTTDSSVMTAVGNDYGYEHLFSRQVQAVGKEHDVLFGFTTSGKSANILAGLREGRRNGLVTVGMTGMHSAQIEELSDFCIRIPSEYTPRIQEGHILLGHIICGLIEGTLFPRHSK